MSKVEEMAKALFSGVRDTVEAVMPGLKDFKAEAGAELDRLGKQGAMELASALFNGHSFVPYGPGQYTATPGQEKGQEAQADLPAQERSGMSR